MRNSRTVLPVILAKLTCTWCSLFKRARKPCLSYGVRFRFRKAAPPSPPDASAEVKVLYLTVEPCPLPSRARNVRKGLPRRVVSLYCFTLNFLT